MATALLRAVSLGFSHGTQAAPTDSPSPTPATNPAKVAPYERLLPTTKVVGSRIKNLQNQGIGTIDDLIFNPDTGRVRFAVLGVGGFLGAGETKVVALRGSGPGKGPARPPVLWPVRLANSRLIG
jgi:hypothetical protein